MMNRKALFAIVAIAVSAGYAGFSSDNFFFYRVKYKNALGLTRHKNFTVPVWENGQSEYWVGMPFLFSRPKAGYAVSMNDGREWMGLSTDLGAIRAMWLNRNDATFSVLNSVDPRLHDHPTLGVVTGLFADEDGYIYVTTNGGWKLISGRLNSAKLMTSWVGMESEEAYIGVTGVNDLGKKYVITAAEAGGIQIRTPSLAAAASIEPFKGEDLKLLSMKSDGKLDLDGYATLWGQAYKVDDGSIKYYLYRVDVNPVSGIFKSEYFSLRAAPDKDVPAGVNPFAKWDDFVPFWAGSESVRILALSGDIVHVFSDRGIWLESPLGAPKVPNADPWYKYRPHDGFFGASVIATTNNRRNWSSQYSVYVVDDFRYSSRGVHRYNWAPDGYDEYLQLDVKMREASGSGEPMSKPVIQIDNLSAYKQLYDAKLRVWFSRQEGYPSDIVADKYWIEDDGTTLETGCSAENPNLCWVDVVFGEEFTLDPGQHTSIDGIQIGVHYTDWRAFDRTNDPSMKDITSSLATNAKTSVYTRGNTPGSWKRVWGVEPSPYDLPLPLGWIKGPPAVDQSLGLINGFESLQGWGSLPSGTTALNHTDKVEGSSSLALIGGGYVSLESKPFPVSTGFKTVSVMIKQPVPPLNPWWLGQIQMYLNCPSAGLNSQWLGQYELSKVSQGCWVKLSFEVPAWVAAKLTSAVNDLSIKIAVNTPAESDDFLLDDMKLEN